MVRGPCLASHFLLLYRSFGRFSFLLYPLISGSQAPISSTKPSASGAWISRVRSPYQAIFLGAWSMWDLARTLFVFWLFTVRLNPWGVCVEYFLNNAKEKRSVHKLPLLCPSEPYEALKVRRGEDFPERPPAALFLTCKQFQKPNSSICWGAQRPVRRTSFNCKPTVSQRPPGCVFSFRLCHLTLIKSSQVNISTLHF